MNWKGDKGYAIDEDALISACKIPPKSCRGRRHPPIRRWNRTCYRENDSETALPEILLRLDGHRQYQRTRIRLSADLGSIGLMQCDCVLEGEMRNKIYSENDLCTIITEMIISPKRRSYFFLLGKLTSVESVATISEEWKVEGLVGPFVSISSIVAWSTLELPPRTANFGVAVTKLLTGIFAAASAMAVLRDDSNAKSPRSEINRHDDLDEGFILSRKISMFLRV